MDKLLRDLTPAQREAVEHVEGPLLILAGPGSGKTRVITHRIAHLVAQGIPAHEILALTFTNKAAEEMSGRVAGLIPDAKVWVGTFHRFCARLLRRHAAQVGIAENYTIYDTDDSRRALRRVVEAAGVDPGHFKPEAIAAAISWAKNNLIGPGDYQPRPGHALGELVQRLYPAYERFLVSCNAVDFDDLLLHVATILRENDEIRYSLDRRWRFVLIDEYQDTNLAQYAIARALSIDHPNLAVTGDPDQSIYGWRGANLKNILEFEKDYPEVRVVRLERNYRSTKRIIEVAAALIAHNKRRKRKDLFTENGLGEPVRLIRYANHREEARGIVQRIAEQIRDGGRRPGDFAIFYRVNALSFDLERALREEGIPFQLVHALEFLQRKEIKDVLGYLQLLGNPRNDLAVLRVINTPARGIGKTTLERLSQHAARRGLTLLDAARASDQSDWLPRRSQPAVRKFVALFDRLAKVAAAPVEELLGHVLTETGYQEELETSEREEDVQRLANIQQLLSIGREFDEQYPGGRQLEAFLELTSLASDTDDWESKNDRVTLMTLHGSKGLEFPVVFLIAAEDGLLPHERSRDNPDQLEEERRLVFVGITRAQQELQISYTASRDFRGQRKVTVPSPFLLELPRERMELEDLGSSYGSWDELYPDQWSRPPAAAPVNTGKSAAPLTTAAQMANGGTAESVSPEAFHQGMVVLHPQYGLGRIIALSGSGANRKATVAFASSAGQRQFVLARSPLQPVKR
ncbi:MAG: UvrD-helicase domain-containing protein [Pirellulales bacterium]|nr:UvrD-helicase domain-containing protein [Pirellulales bacterium]